jgi:hypothetical protein
MQLTMEQAFKTDLAMLISAYITQGLKPGVIEEELYDAVKDLFACDEEPDEQRQWYDTSAELS